MSATSLAVCLLFTWPWKVTALLCGSTILSWGIAALAKFPVAGLDASIFGNNLYFLCLTSGLAVATTAVRYKLARNEFEARTELAKTSSELSGTLQRLRELDRFKS